MAFQPMSLSWNLGPLLFVSSDGKRAQIGGPFNELKTRVEPPSSAAGFFISIPVEPVLLPFWLGTSIGNFSLTCAKDLDMDGLSFRTALGRDMFVGYASQHPATQQKERPTTFHFCSLIFLKY